MRRLTLAQARRLAIAATGLGRARPAKQVGADHYRRVLGHMGVVQLDSVNVLARAHYLPFFSRLGAYPRDLLDQWLWTSQELFEYWGHERSLMPISHRPLLDHRMRGTPRGWIESVNYDNPEYVRQVCREVAEKGPLRVSDLSEPGQSGGSWWGHNMGKRALEWLFWKGAVTVADRPNFIRWFDLPERVHPAWVLAEPGIEEREALRRLLHLAVERCGVGTAADLADYYRMGIWPARQGLSDLVASGDILEVEVEGWSEPAYLDPDAGLPRQVGGRALLSPFDPLVWFRPRIERLFDFRYRIEIYIPRPKRIHGYYVLPFLLGDRMVARVDLKLDRRAKRLMVLGSYGEPDIDNRRVCGELAAELVDMAEWLGAGDVSVTPNGDLASPLARSL
ncbi:MAG: winged helix DNA-binding domain-containing protein [bacterium]|nr:winged helix DNA-binding domain-containing protein [bacterium]MDE0601741.1 winged helix DNA-binding domain-containing protein [bacterium]